jgi:fatty-acyl-CoA synthase
MPASSSGGSALKMRLAVKKTVVLVDEFEPHTVLSAIDRYAVTDTMLVPSMCELLLDDPTIASHTFSSLRLVGISGATVSPSLVERFRAAFGIHPSIFYGMAEGQYGFTETTSLSKPGSVGRTRSEIELKIIDDAWQTLAPGEVGTICARSPYIAAGYYNAPDESAVTFRDGWVRTGDLGYLDADGELFLVGRRNQMIIQSGVNVYPDEIVGVLQRNPGVKDCAVVGVPDDVLGEAVVAALIRAPGTSVTKEAVLARCESELDPRKAPVDVIFVDGLPRNPQGKIDVRALRQQLELITTRRRIELRGRVDRDAEEKMLTTIWIDVLGVPELGIDDDFFALGGTSLLAIRLVTEIASAPIVGLANT